VVVYPFFSFNSMYLLVAQKVLGLAVVVYDWSVDVEIAMLCNALWKRQQPREQIATCDCPL
jgi:hypothetical protein